MCSHPHSKDPWFSSAVKIWLPSERVSPLLPVTCSKPITMNHATGGRTWPTLFCARLLMLVKDLEAGSGRYIGAMGSENTAGTKKFLVCAIGIFASYFIYGILQEKMWVYCASQSDILKAIIRRGQLRVFLREFRTLKTTKISTSRLRGSKSFTEMKETIPGYLWHSLVNLLIMIIDLFFAAQEYRTEKMERNLSMHCL